MSIYPDSRFSIRYVLRALPWARKLIQAGLLTSGSSYLLCLPVFSNSDVYTAFIPGYSGGSVIDFHNVPIIPV